MDIISISACSGYRRRSASMVSTPLYVVPWSGPVKRLLLASAQQPGRLSADAVVLSAREKARATGLEMAVTS
jgi:hypothetical protein